jgi:hypothetical protein
MDEGYEHYFGEQLGRQRKNVNPFWFKRILDYIPKDWRVDARYFLALNLYFMIVHPYFSENRPKKGQNSAAERNFWSLLSEDAARIVWQAKTEAIERGRSQVSSTSVVIAVGKLAPELATASLQIWGDR